MEFLFKNKVNVSSTVCERKTSLKAYSIVASLSQAPFAYLGRQMAVTMETLLVDATDSESAGKSAVAMAALLAAQKA